jgi:aryl-alcohol dehydrogenase
LGHEGAGTIRKLPSAYKGPLSVGDDVLCSFDACGKHCTSCKTGYPAACHSFFPRIFWGLRQDGSTTDCYADEEQKEKINMGFFGQSSFMRTGIVNLGSMVKVDHGLPLHLMCAFGCGIMTGFVSPHSIHKSTTRRGEATDNVSKIPAFSSCRAQ